MKKLLSLFLACGLIMSLLGCSNSLKVSYAETTTAKNESMVVETTMKETTLAQKQAEIDGYTAKVAELEQNKT